MDMVSGRLYGYMKKMQNSRVTILTVDSAPAEAAARLQSAKRNSGFVPNLLGVLANAPAALETYQLVSQINAGTGLSATEREVIQITAAVHNGCAFCVAGHTAISRKKLQMPEALLQALREANAIDDPKLDALARFTLAVMIRKGNASDEEWHDFLAAGYSQASAIEVVLGVSLATLCNYANNLARTPINAELQAHA